ncbi:MAG TPA: hypothetical protein DCS23_01050 [Candidatus Yonathbacteria bacterium]|nr:hypothetical protein [Candidatus Yonathbacteria bacterium]
MEGRKIIKWLLGGIGVAIVIGYSYFVLDDYIRGPRIIIESPLNGYSTTTPAIVITGRGVHTNNLSVNGAQTPVDLEGNFRAQLILAPGYNIIKVTAKDNYERTVEKTLEINLLEYGIENGEWRMGAGTTTQELTAPKSLLPTGQATTTINQF